MTNRLPQARLTLSQKLKRRFEKGKQFHETQITEWTKGVKNGTLLLGQYAQEWITRNWRLVFVCPRCIALAGITTNIGQPFTSRSGEVVSHPPLCKECYCGIRLISRNESSRLERVPSELWTGSGVGPVPSIAGIAEAREAKQWQTAAQLLRLRLDSEERHAASVRAIYGDGPLADPTYYQSLAVVLRKLGNRTGERQVVERFRSQPHQTGTKKVEALLQRA